ncbi:MAG: hypothetical protein Q9169_002308 [Polycauliona sp. 2 TL-2023]
MADKNKTGRGKAPTSRAYSSSSHCGDERGSTGDTTVSVSSEDDPSQGNHLVAAAATTKHPTSQHGTSDTGTGGDGPVYVKEPSAAATKQFETALAHLKSEDHQTKLIGMGQLNAIINTDTNLATRFRNDETAILKAWDTISGRFLDRLLSIVEYKGEQVIDRDWVANQAVSMIHTFLKLVPESLRNDKKFTKRIDKLLVIIGLDMYVLSETKSLALEILDALADTPNGSQALLMSRNWPMLLQSAAIHPIVKSIDDKAYSHAFTHKTAESTTEHVYNLVRWHVPQKELSDAPAWLAPLTQRLLQSASTQYTDALRSRNAVVNLSAALVRCYQSHTAAILYGGRPVSDSHHTAKPVAWLFLQHRLIDIRTSIPALMHSTDGDHKSTLVRLAGCYGLVTAFTKFLAESLGATAIADSDIVGEPECQDSVTRPGGGGSYELPYSPGLLLRIREEISDVCSLSMEYLRDRFEAAEASKTVRRARPGIGSASDRFEFVNKDCQPNMAEDPLVLEQLRLIALWLDEDDSEALRKEAANNLVQLSLGLYGMAVELKSPLLVVLEQCDSVHGALNNIRSSSAWNAMLSDLELIVTTRDVDEYVIDNGISILRLLGPRARNAIGQDKDAWKDFARIAVQLDEDGSAQLLGLKSSFVVWSLHLLRLVDLAALNGASRRLRKRVMAVPGRLLKARDRMDKDTQYAILLTASVYIALVFVQRPADEVSRHVAGALACYHLGPIWRALRRIKAGGESFRGFEGMARSPWSHSHPASTGKYNTTRSIPRRYVSSRSASTVAAAAASTPQAGDARSLATRLKNLLLGSTLALTIIFGYYYTTDTRSSLHEYLVIPCLRYFYPDAEDAHEFGNRALKALGKFGLQPRERGNPDAKGDLAVEVFGHTLNNPIGTSAGIDKHCEIPDVLFGAGPAIVEIGGVTPQPQEGNDKPRVWRIPSQRALINRYGLNSEGADYIAMRLRQRLREYSYHMGLGIDEEAEDYVLNGEAGVPPGSLRKGSLLAVQVAKNKWTKDEDIEAVKKDYVHCTSLLGRYADIIVVNVSSPNTPGLRSLQQTEPLTEILQAVVGAAQKVKRKTPVRVMVKVSPDEDSEADVRGICDAIWDSGVDGVVVGNTTKRRPDHLPNTQRLTAQEQRNLLEQGGYSGYQTFSRTVALVGRYRKMLDEASYSNMNEHRVLSSSTTKPSATSGSTDKTAESPTPETNDQPSITSSIASSAKSLLLETHEETHPPITDNEVEASVSRDRKHLKPTTQEAETDSQSQPIIRLPERTNPLSSTPKENVSSPSSSSASGTLATSSPADTTISSSPSSPSSSPPSSSSSSSSPKSQARKIIFATGGICTGTQALEVLSAGADVAQVYTALVYGGIGTISKMKIEMREELAGKRGSGR